MMEENEEDKTVYYVSKLDQHQRSGKVLHYLPLPPGIGFYFSLTSYSLVAYYEVYIGSFFYTTYNRYYLYNRSILCCPCKR